MVMEASPSPQSVGREFVRQYYTLLNQAPSHLHRFYNNYSSFVHGGLDAPHRETLPVIGQKQIHNQIQQLNFRDCHAKISQVDAQATLGNGVVVQVSGELSNRGAPMRRFTQTFVLAAQSPKKYYVHNDIFRYQDIVVSDEEAEVEPRSSSEDEEPRSYFAPPASAFPPPSAFVPNEPDELNGHDAQPTDQQGVSESSSVAAPVAIEPEIEPEPEPEPEVEPEPVLVPEPPVSNEPKTYANLLKCGPATGAGRVMSMPAYSAPPQPQPIVEQPVPVVKPIDAKPRRERREPREQRDVRDRERDNRERERDVRDRERDSRDARDKERDNRDARDRERDSRDARDHREPSGSQLFVGNVPTGATEAQLKVLFAKFGPVVEVRLVGRGVPNYGFVTFVESRSAKAALHSQLYFPAEGGTRLNLEEKKPRPRPIKHHANANNIRR